MADAHVTWDDAALDDLLNSWDGPVGELIAELSDRAAAVAIEQVHVLPGTPRSRFSWKSTTTALPPGYTREHITSHRGTGAATGRIYGGVNAPATPAVFLEMPARQMTEAYPFLTRGLEAIEGWV